MRGDELFAPPIRGQELERADLDGRQEEAGKLHSDKLVAFDGEASFPTFGQTFGAVVKKCDCPKGWWGTRCRRLDLCVMSDANTRLLASEPRCKHGEMHLT